MRIINRHPSRGLAILLASLPFIALVIAYSIGSYARLSVNPADKILPSLAQMSAAMYEYAFVPEKRSGNYILWADTAISLWRFFTALSISVTISLVFGVFMGFIPWARATFRPFVEAFSLIPPITVLPILFIIVGLDEASKISLIVIGITPLMTRAVAQAVEEIPYEMLVKAQTLGASTWQMLLRLVLPQVMPRLIIATRYALIPAWIFLVSAEAIAATGGLGYRIFLVRRFLSMDVIIPYVVWITLLAFITDLLLDFIQRKAYPWHLPENKK